MAKEAIIVNLFGGAGCGKTTGSARIFSDLKMAGVECELASEFVKSRVWSGDKQTFRNQVYILGNQSFKITRCLHQVDVIITDSPILLSMYYNTDEKLQTGYFNSFIVDYFNQFKNMNYLLYRCKPYDPKGRFQTEEEAKQDDFDIQAMLYENEIPYRIVNGDLEGYDQITKEVLQQLNKEREYFTFS